MIKRKLKLCHGCKTEQYIWTRGMCKECSYKAKNKTMHSGMLKTGIAYKKKPTGEKQVFLEIWNTRPHICEHCKSPLGNEPKAFMFSHIKPKSTHNELRLDINNISLYCFDCHYTYGCRGKEDFEKRKDLFIKTGHYGC